MGAPVRSVTGTLEPPAGPLPRADLVILLRTAKKLIETLTTPVGGLFRRGYLQRLSDAIEREDRAAPEPTALVVMGRWVNRMERRGQFAVLQMEAATVVLDADAVRRAAVVLGIALARDRQ